MFFGNTSTMFTWGGRRSGGANKGSKHHGNSGKVVE